MLAVAFLCVSVGCGRQSPPAGEWRSYGGSNAQDHYAPLTQIGPSNIGDLDIAWRYETGEGGLQTSPLMIGGRLFAVTPGQKVIALNAATGALIWKFESDDQSMQPTRGLSFWQGGNQRRLFVSASSFLYALDPDTGRPAPEFGEGGRIDLRRDLDRDPETSAVFMTSPGIVFKNLIIVGFRTSESPPAPPGDIRAYDVRSGALRWSFHTIPRPGETGHETWPAEAWRSAGGANNWAGMALDEDRGIVFAPTGSAVPDFFGGDRLGDNLFANSLLALDANTGRLRWHYQIVHHDIWDRDLPSPPVLVTVRRDGRTIDAVAQATKHGALFVFDRETGEPLFPVEERAVPQSDLPGERTAATQPFPLLPRPFARQTFTEDTLTRRTQAAYRDAREHFGGMRSEGPFTPWRLDQQTIVFPGFDGGAEWGGQAFDARTGVLYLNANDVPWVSSMAPTPPAASPAEALYTQHCAACHGAGREGAPPEFPSLRGIGSRLFDYQIAMIIAGGKGRMPGFPQISEADRSDLIDYLRAQPRGADREVAAAGVAARQPYTFTGYNRFRDPDGYPGTAPPWGTLNAINLNTGEYVWTAPLGEYPELSAQGVAPTGTENYGGPLLTASGLLFIGATVYDRSFRAFDAATGEVLWTRQLPYAGVATPISYMVAGRQFVVIAASGARDREGPQGSAYIAFALPSAAPR